MHAGRLCLAPGLQQLAASPANAVLHSVCRLRADAVQIVQHFRIEYNVTTYQNGIFVSVESYDVYQLHFADKEFKVKPWFGDVVILMTSNTSVATSGDRMSSKQT